MDYNMNFAQQGWQCPICKRVYSPTTAMCFYCGDRTTMGTTNGIDKIVLNDGNNITVNKEPVVYTNPEDNIFCSGDSFTTVKCAKDNAPNDQKYKTYDFYLDHVTDHDKAIYKMIKGKERDDVNEDGMEGTSNSEST